MKTQWLSALFVVIWPCINQFSEFCYGQCALGEPCQIEVTGTVSQANDILGSFLDVNDIRVGSDYHAVFVLGGSQLEFEDEYSSTVDVPDGRMEVHLGSDVQLVNTDVSYRVEASRSTGVPFDFVTFDAFGNSVSGFSITSNLQLADAGRGLISTSWSDVLRFLANDTADDSDGFHFISANHDNQVFDIHVDMSSVRVAPGSTVAQEIVWVGEPGTVGEWHEPANWANGSPAAFESFVIDNDGIAELSMGTAVGTRGEVGQQGTGQFVQTGGSLGLSDLYLGTSLGAHGTYRLESGIAEVEDLRIGAPGEGNLEVHGGVLTVNGTMDVGGQPGRGHVVQTGGIIATPVSYAGEVSISETGLYELSGSGLLEAHEINISGEFIQSGGTVLIHAGVTLNRPRARLTIEPGGHRFISRGIRLQGNRVTTVSQFGAAVETNFLSLAAGNYDLQNGELLADEITLDSTDTARFIQSGGIVAANSLRLRSSTDGTKRGSVEYVISDGELRSGRLELDGDFSATFRQQGGSVRFDRLELMGNLSEDGQAAYVMDASTLHIVKSMVLAEDETYQSATLDFTSSENIVTTGRGSYVHFGPHVRILNGENTTFRLGADSVVAVPEGLDISSYFGEFDDSKAVLFRLGSVLTVPEDQRAQLGGPQPFQHGVIVDGYVYGDPVQGEVEILKTFRVNRGGQADLGFFSEVRVEGDSGAGVYGGTASLGRLWVSSGSFTDEAQFTVDQGGQLDVHGDIRLEANDNTTTFVLHDGTVSVDNFYVNRGAVLRQLEGTLTATRLDIGDQGRATAEFHSGTVSTFDTAINESSTFVQYGGTHKTRRFYGGGTYELRGGELVIDGEFNTGSTSVQVNLAGTDANVVIESAILSFNPIQPFRNAQNGSITIDENSLVILNRGYELESAFGQYENNGLTHVRNLPLVIPEDREIHGTGELGNISRVDIYGRLIAKESNLGLSLPAEFHIHPGARVDLGNGSGRSIFSDDAASSIHGGTFMANSISLDPDAKFRQFDGDVTVNSIRISSGAVYELRGGSLTIERELLEGTVDFMGSDGSFQLGQGGFLALNQVGMLSTENASLSAADESLITVPPGYDPSQAFASFQSHGIVHTRGETLVVPDNGVLTGDVEISDSVTNNGLIRPGFAIGEIAIGGDFRQESSGKLVIEIGNIPRLLGADLLFIDGPAFLDGTLEVQLSDGFVPLSDASYTILHSGGINGFFANAERDVVTANRAGLFDVRYDLQDVILTNYRPIRVAVDLNYDGLVNVEDVDLLVGEIVTGGSAYDLTQDGNVNQEDLSAWLTDAGSYHGFADSFRPGDANLDGIVSPGDLNVVGLNWRQDVVGWSSGDFTADGVTDARDLNLMGVNWLSDIRATVGASVPEPGLGGSFMGLVSLAGFMRRRRREYRSVTIDDATMMN